MMDPDDMSDEQLMRMVTLGMAVVFAGPSDHIRNVCAIAEHFAHYIETGQKPLR